MIANKPTKKSAPKSKEVLGQKSKSKPKQPLNKPHIQIIHKSKPKSIPKQNQRLKSPFRNHQPLKKEPRQPTKHPTQPAPPKEKSLKEEFDTLCASINKIDSIFESFESQILNSKNFTINSVELKSNNANASELLTFSRFWTVYIKYLSQTFKIGSVDDLLSVFNEGFKFVQDDPASFRGFYLKIIKNYLTVVEKRPQNEPDEYYMQLLERNVQKIAYCLPDTMKIAKLEEKTLEKDLRKTPENQMGPLEIQEAQIDHPQDSSKMDIELEPVQGQKFSFSNNKMQNSEMKSSEVDSVSGYSGSVQANIVAINKMTNDELKDKVDDKVFYSSLKEKNIMSGNITPFKSKVKSHFSSNEKYPEDMVEGSIQKFNQSFHSDSQQKQVPSQRSHIILSSVKRNLIS